MDEHPTNGLLDTFYAHGNFPCMESIWKESDNHHCKVKAYFNTSVFPFWLTIGRSLPCYLFVCLQLYVSIDKYVGLLVCYWWTEMYVTLTYLFLGNPWINVHVSCIYLSIYSYREFLLYYKIKHITILYCTIYTDDLIQANELCW